MEEGWGAAVFMHFGLGIVRNVFASPSAKVDEGFRGLWVHFRQGLDPPVFVRDGKDAMTEYGH